MSNLRESAVERLKRWRRDPVAFVREAFGVEPDHWQAEALRAFADRNVPRIAMKANKGPGKTAVLAWMIWNFLACWGKAGAHPKGKATGISERNLDDNLWPELSKWQQRCAYLRESFTWTKTRIFANDHPETWFFSKQPWPKSGDAQQQADTLSGLHEFFCMFVLDESGGIPNAVMATAEAALATREPGDFKKIVQAGNPTHTEGPLWDACSTHKHLWHVIEITGDPDNPKRSQRISKEWARQQIEMYGRDNPWVLVNVFGQFPPSSINALLGPDEVRAAMTRHSELRREQYSWAQKRLGVDVARFGDDRTVLAPRQGLMAHRMIVLRQQRTTLIAGRVSLARRNWGPEIIFVDDSGHWGHGVIDNLLAAKEPVVPVLFEDTALDARYKNRRAEMWLGMAEWVRRGGALPNIPELTAELTVPTYMFHNGVFVLEEKKMIKERLGRSPDLADALALTFAIPDQPDNMANRFKGSRGHQMAAPGQVLSEWDPFEEVLV